MSKNQSRIRAISNEIDSLQERIRTLIDEKKALSLEDAHEEYNCPCVCLNRDLGIHDMQQQEARKRKPLGLGLVSETLTAAIGCLMCQGTGTYK